MKEVFNAWKEPLIAPGRFKYDMYYGWFVCTSQQAHIPFRLPARLA
jgi:hypothetical protein